MPTTNRAESLKESNDLLEREIQRLETLKSRDKKLSKENEDYLYKLEQTHRRELFEKDKREREELQKRIHEAELKNAEEEGAVREQLLIQAEEKAKEIRENSAKIVTDAVVSGVDYVTNRLNDSIELYLNNVQALGAHLVGTGSSLSSLTDNLNNALTGTGLVSQQRVFENLTSYVKSGIVYNVEQRAFLRTIADDIGLAFDNWTASMNQLVRLQGSDSTANRLALEYSLQEFLNEHYKTSEYLVQEFSNVSNSLLTAQSTMTASNAMAFEGTVQGWLGQMYSAGMSSSTVNSLANAINQLGSGDLSNLGSGISNLVLMGAARAGLDYGSILNNGLNAQTTDKLLASITSYLQEMGANQSNVVRSQLGNLFGVNITDLIASNNMQSTSGTLNTDINNLLNDYSSFTPMSKQLSTLVDNMFFSWGTNIASNPLWYGSYMVENMLSSVLGSALSGFSIEAGLPFLKGEVNLGKVAQALPLVTLLPTLLQTIGWDLIPSIKSNTSGLAGIYASLGESNVGTTVRLSDAGVSGSMYLGSLSSSNLLNNSMSSLNDLVGQTVTIEDEGPTLEENVMTITETTLAILDLLTEKLDLISDDVNTLALSSNSSSYNTGWSNITNFPA